MSDPSKHLNITHPSPWIVRFGERVASGGRVLDLACGGGRHGRWFLDRGHPVLFADKNVSAVQDLTDDAHADVHEIDLEDGKAWPFDAAAFQGIVVSNYLFRPHFEGLLASLAPGGVLLYETFARGNETFSKPRNPDHLLKSGELLDLAGGRLQVVAYEHGILQTGDLPGVKQRICAINDLAGSDREDGDPPNHSLNYPMGGDPVLG